MGQVVFNCARRNAKLQGNLLCAFAFEQQVNYFYFLIGKLALLIFHITASSNELKLPYQQIFLYHSVFFFLHSLFVPTTWNLSYNKTKMKTKMFPFFSWLVTILVPLVLIGLGLRLLLTTAFLQVEYNMPYFPRDEYGFTKEDRLRWAPYALKFLINSAEISYLGDLKFDDGTPLYNERELSHMEDVKQVTKGALNLWYATLAILLGLGIWSKVSHWEQAYRQGLMRGGWLMVGLAGVIGLIVAIGIVINPYVFWGFFTAFHKLFFVGDSWLFLYSDTLIRLFPIRFWQDAFLLAAVIALGGGVALGMGLKGK